MKSPLIAVLVLSLGVSTAGADHAEFAAELGAVRKAVLRDTDAPARFQRATQESGPKDPLLVMQRWLIELVRKASPSVVVISAPPKEAEPGTAPSERASLCTGFFVDPKYLGRTVIVSNAHCVEHLKLGDEVLIGLHGEKSRPKMQKGRVLAYGDSEAAKDIAFLELLDPSQNRPGLQLWTKVDVGEQVVAIGNPHGFMYSVSQGIVSGLERDRMGGKFVLDATQSDVAVNPGNSGGPLFNAWGSVIGINSMIYSRDGGSIGLSFSLPSEYIIKALAQYKRTGNLIPGAIQVQFGPDKDMKKLLIQAVTAGGPADIAGLRVKDELLSVDGINLEGGEFQDAMKEFIVNVKYKSPGETVIVAYRRDGRIETAFVTIGEAAKDEEPKKPRWAPIPKPT